MKVHKMTKWYANQISSGIFSYSLEDSGTGWSAKKFAKACRFTAFCGMNRISYCESNIAHFANQ